MRIVLDTNVLMSAVFFSGIPGQIIEAWKAGRLTVVVSPDILEEYRTVAEILGRQYGIQEAGELRSFLAVAAELIEAPALPAAVSRDSDDDKFLACALFGRAAAVVSGDDDLLSLGSWQGIKMLSPREFVDTHLAGR